MITVYQKHYQCQENNSVKIGKSEIKISGNPPIIKSNLEISKF